MKRARERRLGDRVLMSRAAKLVEDGGRVSEIKILDLSPTGARIMAPQSLDIPHYFTLRIPRDGSESRVERVWRNGIEVGLRFVNDASAEAPSRPEAAAVPPPAAGARLSLAALRGMIKAR